VIYTTELYYSYLPTNLRARYLSTATALWVGSLFQELRMELRGGAVDGEWNCAIEYTLPTTYLPNVELGRVDDLSWTARSM
jgi:hypothetical protein